MTKKRFRTLEKPSGTGEVHEDGKYLATVSYSLHVRQEIIISETFGGKEEIPGYSILSGKVTVLRDERNLQASEHPNLRLNLSDGRHLDFYSKSGNPVSGTYEIRPVGGEGLTRTDK